MTDCELPHTLCLLKRQPGGLRICKCVTLTQDRLLHDACTSPFFKVIIFVLFAELGANGVVEVELECDGRDWIRLR